MMILFESRILIESIIRSDLHGCLLRFMYSDSLIEQLNNSSASNVLEVIKRIKEQRISDPNIMKALILATVGPDSEKTGIIEDELYSLLDLVQESVLQRLLYNDIWEVRSKAIELLGLLRTKQSMPDIIKLLDDDHEMVRIEAAEVLGKLQISQAYKPLLRKLKDEYWLVIGYAAFALGQIGNRNAIGALKKCLLATYQAEHSIDETWVNEPLWTRINIWAALYLLGESKYLLLLLNMLKTHEVVPTASLLATITKYCGACVRSKILREIKRAKENEDSEGNLESLAEAIERI